MKPSNRVPRNGDFSSSAAVPTRSGWRASPESATLPDAGHARRESPRPRRTPARLSDSLCVSPSAASPRRASGAARSRAGDALSFGSQARKPGFELVPRIDSPRLYVLGRLDQRPPHGKVLGFLIAAFHSFGAHGLAPLLAALHRFRGAHDRHALVVLQIDHVSVSRDDEIGACGESRGDYHIVSRVLG